MREDEPDVLEMLIRHELALKQLYELFATMFTNHTDFWQNLARDEQSHADWLIALRSNSIACTWLLYESRLKFEAIKTSISYVESKIAKAEEGNISILQALSIAKDLESALLERQFSKLKDSAPKEIGAVMMRLANETERHLKTVVEVINSETR